MADDQNSYKPKFRKHGHGHTHHHHHPPHPQQSAELPEVSIHVDSTTKGEEESNELFIVDVFDGETGKEGHTAVAIYGEHSKQHKARDKNAPIPVHEQNKSELEDSHHRKKSKKKAKNSTSKASGYDDDEESLRKLPTISSRCGKDLLWVWGEEEVDTQDVACDTVDLDRLMPAAHFILNFTHYDQDEFNVHVGLRKKIPYYGGNANSDKCFVPPTTDDYNREFFRHLKTQENMEILTLVLEVHVDDDIYNFKVFDEDGVSYSGPDASDTRSEYPIIHSNLGAFWNTKTIPTGLTFLHVEMPGLSQFYLNDWKRFMEMQSNLTTLICNFGSVLWTFYAKVVLNNDETLEKIVLRRVISYDVRFQRQVPFDFGVFQGCTELTYLKVTGGGFKERWGEWAYLGQEQPQEERLLHVNFDLIPTDKLIEFHFAKMNISKRRLQNLALSCAEKKLQLICADCPDRVYYDADWKVPSKSQNLLPSQILRMKAEGDKDVELSMLDNGCPAASRHVEILRTRQQKKNNLIVFLLVLSIISFISMTIAVAVAIYYSNKGRSRDRDNL